jgi:tubulin polyglutamylase TTLL6/13
MHLTNYAINKKNPKYIFNNSVHSMNIGHKRSLTSVYKNIEKKGGSVE